MIAMSATVKPMTTTIAMIQLPNMAARALAVIPEQIPAGYGTGSKSVY